MKRRVSIWVSGRVQGVSFRYYTQKQAQQLGVIGEVKNLADGRVAILAQADTLSLEKFIAWCHQGAPTARVDAVEIVELSPDDSLKTFVITR